LNLPLGHLRAKKDFYFLFTPFQKKVNNRKIKISEILKLLFVIFLGGMDRDVDAKG